MNRKSITITLLLTSSIALLSRCQNKTPSETYIENLSGQKIQTALIDSFVDSIMQAKNIPGISLAIINDGKVVYHKVQGYADVLNEEPITGKTLFEGASLSKPLFAYFTMQFVDDGLLDLDKPLFEYMPYPDIEYDERYKQITARMVLSHTTGFPNWRSDFAENKLFIGFQPGTKFQYSGEGFQYLAKVLMHLLHTDDDGLEAHFQQKIAGPFGLEFTKFVQNEYNLKHKAMPHLNGKRIKQQLAKQVFGAAFSIHTESLEYARWLITLMNKKGLRSDSYNNMFSNQVKLPEDSDQRDQGVTHWTLGFSRLETPFGTLLTHGGNNPGYTSAFGIDMEKKWGAVYFTNANQVSEIGIELFSFLHQESF